MFLFRYHGLWCPVYCLEWHCQFALVDSIIWLPDLHGLFRLILAHGHAVVHRLILPLFPCIRYSVAKHTLYDVLYVFSFINTAHADMIRSFVSSNCWHGLRLLSQFVIFFLHHILFVMTELVLLLFHFHFQLSPPQPQKCLLR